MGTRIEGGELIAGQVALSADAAGDVAVRIGGAHYIIPAADVPAVAEWFAARVVPAVSADAAPGEAVTGDPVDGAEGSE